MRSPLVQLLTARRFAPLFVTQFLGAFNDNLLKSAMGIVVTFRLAEQSGLDSASLVMLAGAVFIAPFFLFSGASGTLADRVDKSLIARIVKVAEIGIMTLGAVGLWLESVPLLFAALFCLGTHSTVFGPIKYALLPQHLREDELVAGNALIEAGTFLAILLGHDPRRKRGPARQRGAHRRRLRRRQCAPGLACRASDPAGAILGCRCASPAPAARHDRRRRSRDVASGVVAADPRGVLVLAVWRHRGVGTAGVCQRRALRERAGGDDDAGALRCGRRRRIDCWPSGCCTAR